ncbi:UNVERIFIED_CONTAM: hypothetical protein FKN15_067089 [Acipenser sinensis]
MTHIYIMHMCDRDRMMLGARSPSRPVRARYNGNRVPLPKRHDNLFRRVGGHLGRGRGYGIRTQ